MHAFTSQASRNNKPNQKPRNQEANQSKARGSGSSQARAGEVALEDVPSSAMAADLGFEETELRLSLPGGGGGGGYGEARSSSGKRGFAETIDLKLKLEPAAAAVEKEAEEGDVAVVADAAAATDATSPAAAGKMKRSPSQSSVVTAQPDPEKPRAAKAQVVGWPPVRSFRKNILAVQAEKGAGKEDGDKSSSAAGGPAAFVKVSMDGAPYLRKVDLKMYKSYQELSKALDEMFSSFTIGNCGSQGMNGMNESKLMDLLNGSEYVPTYEDKDGDWMLVGDVPWEMFVESCKRLRIMQGSEAIGLAPRAMEKCKNRS